MQKTYIAREQFDAIISKYPTLTITRQTGYTRVEAATDRRLYVPNGKKVAKCDFACFTVPDPEAYGVIDLGDEKRGSVHQEIDFSKPAEEVLASFELVLQYMMSLPPLEKATKTRSKSNDFKVAVVDPQKLEAAKAARMALIAKVTAEKRVAISLVN